MKDLLVRFMREEDGDTVQTVIIIAIFAALALAFGKVIKQFVKDLVDKINTTGDDTGELIDKMDEIQSKGE